MVEKVRVEGLKELEVALRDLKKSTGKAVIGRALTRAAKPIAEKARETAPVDDGHLQRGIGVSKVQFSSGAAGKRAFAEALKGGATRAQARIEAQVAAAEAARGVTAALIVVGAGRHPQAIFQEFGTVKHGPQPFLRPAWDQNRLAAASTIKDALEDEIDKAAKRAERKAAREAAKASGG